MLIYAAFHHANLVPGAQTRPPGPAQSKSFGPNPEQWRLPADFSIASFYRAEEVVAAIQEPESVTLHQLLKVGLGSDDHEFETTGISPDESDRELLQDMLSSPSAYAGHSACLFYPSVLIRFQRDGYVLDLVVCLGCEDFYWGFDDGRYEGAAGLSDAGAAVIRSVCSNYFPDSPRFR